MQLEITSGLLNVTDCDCCTCTTIVYSCYYLLDSLHATKPFQFCLFEDISGLGRNGDL